MSRYTDLTPRNFADSRFTTVPGMLLDASSPRRLAFQTQQIDPVISQVDHNTTSAPTDKMTSEPLIYIIMGVSGCGKSTVGQALARRLQCAFYDADGYHPETNISESSLHQAMVAAKQASAGCS